MRIVNNVCKGKMSYISILIALFFFCFFFFKENLETSLPGGQGGDIEANGDVKGEGVLTTIEWLWIGGTWAPNSLLFCGHHK